MRETIFTCGDCGAQEKVKRYDNPIGWVTAYINQGKDEKGEEKNDIEVDLCSGCGTRRLDGARRNDQ